MSTGRISNLYRVSFLCGDSVESRARRGDRSIYKAFTCVPNYTV